MSNATEREGNTSKATPPGWRWVRLGEVCEFEYGAGLPTHSRRDGSVPVYGSNGIVGFHAEALTRGPVIIVGRKGSIGEVHYSPEPCWPIDTTYFIEHPKIECDLQWLTHCLRVLRLGELNKGTAVPGLNRDDAHSLLIPLPPLPEQRRIAAILTEQMKAVERARNAAQAQLEASANLSGAYLRETFDCPESKRWTLVRLGDISELVNGDAYRETDWSHDGVPIIRIQNLNDVTKPFNYWSGNLHDRVVVRPGDVLLAWSGTPGTSFGAHLWRRGQAVLNQHIFRVDIDKTRLDNHWAVAAINQQLDTMIRKAHGGVGLRHVTKREVESLAIPAPPIPEQQRIVSALSVRTSTAHRARTAIEAQTHTINTLPAALLREAFSGRL